MESDFDIDKILSEIDEDDEWGNLEGENDGTVTDRYIDEHIDRESETDEEEEVTDIQKDDEDIPHLTGVKNGSTGISSEEFKNEGDDNEEISTENISDAEEKKTTGLKKYRNYTVKGTKSWNTRTPYLISINDEKLKQHEEYFTGAFFFIKEDVNEETIKDEIKRSFAGFMRNPSRNISEEYKEFIFKLIISESEMITDFFNIPDEKKDLFIYHIGPSTMHNIITGKFRKKAGLVYRYDNANRRAVSFFPDEFIKLKILDWYEENINTKELQFDSAQILDDLTITVSRIYLAERKKFNIKLDKINYKLGNAKRISSQELLRLKGDEWFGSGCVAVYKRFLHKTMFK